MVKKFFLSISGATAVLIVLYFSKKHNVEENSSISSSVIVNPRLYSQLSETEKIEVIANKGETVNGLEIDVEKILAKIYLGKDVLQIKANYCNLDLSRNVFNAKDKVQLQFNDCLEIRTAKLQLEDRVLHYNKALEILA